MVDDLAEGPELAGEAVADRGRPIVLALDQRRAIDIAAPRHAGRVRRLVVDMAGRLTDPAA
jgi:hypothetical protein